MARARRLHDCTCTASFFLAGSNPLDNLLLACFRSGPMAHDGAPHAAQEALPPVAASTWLAPEAELGDSVVAAHGHSLAFHASTAPYPSVPVVDLTGAHDALVCMTKQPRAVITIHTRALRRHAPRQEMRSLLLERTAWINDHWFPDHSNEGCWEELSNSETCPWHDFIATLPEASKTVACGPRGVVCFGIASFPEELDPNTHAPRVDFQVWQQDGCHVRLHPGKSAAGDAEPVVLSSGPAVTSRKAFTARFQRRLNR